MRIASYNIRKAVGLDWRRDPNRIVDVLLEIDADIVVFQEADRRTGVLPLDRLKTDAGYILADVVIRPTSHGWHGNAMLARKDLAIIETTRSDLPMLEPRGAISAQVSGHDREVIGVHFGLLPATRRKQVPALTDRVTAHSRPAIIAGDSNGFLHDSGTLEGVWEIVIQGPSFHAALPSARLDPFLLFGSLSHSAAHVYDSSLARRASDHLPVVIDTDIEMSAP